MVGGDDRDPLHRAGRLGGRVGRGRRHRRRFRRAVEAVFGAGVDPAAAIAPPTRCLTKPRRALTVRSRGVCPNRRPFRPGRAACPASLPAVAAAGVDQTAPGQGRSAALRRQAARPGLWRLSARALQDRLQSRLAAAKNGDPAAQTLVAEILSRGLGVPRNAAAAAKWYALAAEQGVPEAQFQYALMLLDGRFVKKDEKEPLR